MRRGGETRALWVVRYTMTSPESVKELVEKAKSHGFTDLVVQIRGRGDAFYTSSIEPRADALMTQPVSFDPLAQVIKQAHASGIRVHAWINMFLVADVEKLPTSPKHLIYRNPERLMTPKKLSRELYKVNPTSPYYFKRLLEFTRANRVEVEGLYSSPAHPGVRDEIYRVWMEVASKYDVDGLHFDYVRYPNAQYDYGKSSLDLFKSHIDKKLSPIERRSLTIQAANNPFVYSDRYFEEFSQFQRDQVSDLVSKIYTGVKRIKPNVLISAAVFADNAYAYGNRFQDWKLWVKRGNLDIVCPMAYTTDTEVFRKQISEAVKIAGGSRVWGGIGAYKQSAAGSLEKIRATRDIGTGGFVLFSYDSVSKSADYLEQIRTAF